MKNKFDKFAESCSKHPFRNAIVLFLFLAVVPTFIIHVVYTLPHMFGELKIFRESNFFKSYFFKAKIPAGNLLAYIGTALTFCATFMLSMTVYLSNKEQAERMQLIENKALFLVNNQKMVKVDLLNPKKEKLDDIFIAMEWNVLSDAIISKIIVKCLSIEDMDHPRDREKQFFIEYEKEENISFKYQEGKKRIKITLDLKDEKAQKILRKDHWISIAGDFEVYCENVKTPVTMNVNCWSDEENNDIIAHMEYEIRDSNFFSRTAKLC